MTDGTLPNLLPIRKLKYALPSGELLSYTITTLTLDCYLVEADQSPEVLQFANYTTLNQWWQRVKLSLEEANTHTNNLEG